MRRNDMAEFVWTADAEYADGSEVHETFEPDRSISEEDDQYNIECWLLERKEGCTWFAVGIEYVDPIE